MDVSILKTVGQIAGIGGIALGVFLIVLRDVLRKRIFPQLTREQAYKLLRQISLSVWSVAVLGIGAWLVAESRQSITVTNGVAAGRDINATGIMIQGGGQAPGSP